MVHIPPPPDSEDADAFAPAAPRPRRDGWTPAVQTAFIAALAAGDSLTAACRRVCRSPKSAYALRRRADAAGFAAAWDAAVAEVEAVATSAALDRCLEGTRRPVVYRGRIVGERVVHNDRLLMHMLRRSPPGGRPVDPYAAFAAALDGLCRNNSGGASETFE